MTTLHTYPADPETGQPLTDHDLEGAEDILDYATAVAEWAIALAEQNVPGMPHFTFGWLVPQTDRMAHEQAFVKGVTDCANILLLIAPEVALAEGPEGFFETLWHELAHAMLGPGHDHCAHWAELVTRLGGHPVACDASGPLESLHYWMTSVQFKDWYATAQTSLTLYPLPDDMPAMLDEAV